MPSCLAEDRELPAGPGSGGGGGRLGGQARLDPVLDALAVLPDLAVAERGEDPGHALAVGAGGVRAVDDDRGVTVRKDLSCAVACLVDEQVDRTGQVLLVVVAG